MIKFSSKDTDFKLTRQKVLKDWIKKILNIHSLKVGDINYLLTNDEEVLKVNKEFLGHDYYTDIITFDTSDYDPEQESDDVVSADIVISVDTVRANAVEYGASFEEELHRVIIHGILHLIGYDDHSDEDRAEMQNQENIALELLRGYES
ncbi:MAG: rRNA maturation RNase YbeY [Bacteroidales bacterium]|nr:rRNA maturation RNase YbeY [Bacteroidales bacterium]